MTLTRYQIRNEHGLADRALYQSTDKEDDEALLDGSSMAGLVGLLRQLGDLAEFAGEVFHNLHEELMNTAARGTGLAIRLQQLEVEIPKSVEIPILSQADHTTFFCNPGLEWRSTLQRGENLISPSKLPHCIMDSYEECRGPPQLYLLDKFDVDGSGSCLKRYSDPSFLKKLTASSVSATSKLSKDERPSNTKKKVSQMSNAERPGDSQTSHAKLHQLFLVDHVENGHNDEFHVKLKRRHLNGPQINLSSGTGYMEKFLKNALPYCGTNHETLDQASSTMDTEITACKEQEDLSTLPLVYPSNGDTRKEREMELIADDERVEREMVCVERSSCVNFCGNENNDTYALASTETQEKEEDSDDNASGNLCPEILAQFSNVLCHSSEEGESSPLKLTQEPGDASEGGTKDFQTNDAEDDHSQHVFSVETESEMSLTGLVEDHLSSITNQETEKDPDCLLIENRHISTFDNLEDLSLDADVQHDSAAPEEDETNSHDGYPMNTKQSGNIYTLKISSEVGTQMLDTPRDVHTGNMNLSASSCQEDTLANSDLAEISSDSGQEDPQTMPIVEDIPTFETSSENGTLLSDTPRDIFTGTMNLSASSCQEDALAISDLADISSDSKQEDPQTMSIIEDEGSEIEVQIPDTQRDGTVFVGDNQTSLHDKDSETMPDVDLTTISDPQECLLDTQECFSAKYYTQTHGQGQESPPETESETPAAAVAAESLPPQEVPIGVQFSPSEEKEALNAPDQGTITSLNGNLSEPVLSMEPTDQETCLDVPMAPFSTSLHEAPQEYLEIAPALPPLPPTQWWMGKLVQPAKTTETQFSPVPSLAYNGNNSFYTHRDENTHNGSVQATEAQDPSEAAVTDQLLNKPSKATEEEQSPREPVAWVSLLRPEATPEAVSTEGLEALEWFSQNLKEHANPNLAKLEEDPQLDHPLEPQGETEQDNNSYEHNEKVEKLPRENDSLVIGIDKSMLRKASERNRTQLGARVEENDSILEIIRSKSFNLRPADASVRHNFQVAVPTTNLKVAAILEKANSLRHAMAGSDDDQDSDSWSE